MHAATRLDGLKAFVQALEFMAVELELGKPMAGDFGETLKAAAADLDGDALAGFHQAAGFWIGMVLRDGAAWSPRAMRSLFELFERLAMHQQPAPRN